MSKEVLHYGTVTTKKLTPRQRVVACAIGFAGTGLVLAIGWVILACLVRFGIIRVW